MFKFTFFFLITLLSVQAQTMVVDYRVEFGIIGQVAKVHTLYHDHKKSYMLDTNVTVVGLLAKTATGNLKERHICKGFLSKNGLRIANSYQMIKSYGAYKSMTLYRVNHNSKKVRKTYKKWQIYNTKPDKIIEEYSYDLAYYAQDDMVTLFLNLDKDIQDKNTENKYIFKAVGADKKNGRVDIIIPTKQEKKEMITLVGEPKKDEWLMNLIMHRQLYNSKQGELMVRMGKESIIEKAVLKDLIFFGDVRIIRE